ncbi:unnamed protein product [Mucor hiemalis]
MNRQSTTLPPPVPTHYSPPNISIIQPQSNFDNNNKNATIDIVPPSIKSPSYLGKQQQSKKKRSVQANEMLLEYDSSTSSSDESEGGYSNRFSSQSLKSKPSEEHKFWQVHSSTTIIAPPMTETDFSAAINMNYVNPRTLKKQATVVARIPLAIQVRNILSSTFEDVDEEIEREWESSLLPTQSLSSPSY